METASLSIVRFIQGFTHELATELLEYSSGGNLWGSIGQCLPDLSRTYMFSVKRAPLKTATKCPNGR